MEYKNFLIVTYRHHAGLELSAIPDSGETIRRRFYFYTEEEAIEVMKEEIDALIDCRGETSPSETANGERLRPQTTGESRSKPRRKEIESLGN